MRKTNNAADSVVKKQWRPAAERISYQQLAGSLAAEMADCIRSVQSEEFSAPFRLVIVDPKGAIVFRGEVSEDWTVHYNGPDRLVRHSHFPATALLTDRALVTRTFQIERGL